ncbi:hypothetical protein Lsan_1929 [Legionella santicrucis]|uniref:Uncharacterized protein n=1 Tax=Legionella santicrucis TaxID=45074 RepID=A0A0W0YWM0_9GAMM|nr:hypothetical protein [Legionella santicrucis]KTD60902.1 hypothetical protein Lsan_1929 [Legionella santicrucis]
MMFFKRFVTPNTLSKVIKNHPTTNTPYFFKQMDWSLAKKSEQGQQLSKFAQTIVKELENTSSSDAPGPLLKN